jgi:KUP system potassium uptake protein
VVLISPGGAGDAALVVQRRGTADIGKFFTRSPWSGFVIALTGWMDRAEPPAGVVVLLVSRAALCKHYVIVSSRWAQVAVTGAEALYADMGISQDAQLAGLVWPGGMPLPRYQTISPAGAGSQAAENPFYLMTPDWALIPMVVLATATVDCRKR